MEAILYAYQVPAELVRGTISVNEDTSRMVDDKTTFDLNFGVLQYDTFAPCLFTVVIDFVLRSFMIDKCCFLISKKLELLKKEHLISILMILYYFLLSLLMLRSG